MTTEPTHPSGGYAHMGCRCSGCNDRVAMAPVAVWCSRWRFDTTDLGDLSNIGPDGPKHAGRVGSWWYKVAVQGQRGAILYVDLLQGLDGKPPLVLTVKSRGGYLGHGPRRDAIERAAVEALS